MQNLLKKLWTIKIGNSFEIELCLTNHFYIKLGTVDLFIKFGRSQNIYFD